jgi:quinol monooxygenase YgiN
MEENMFTAMVEYTFKIEELEMACKIWEEQVLELAKKQKGFIRIQFYTNPDGKAMALGSWESKEDAQTFMQTGVFKDLLEKLTDITVEAPKHQTWDLRYFAD